MGVMLVSFCVVGVCEAACQPSALMPARRITSA